MLALGFADCSSVALTYCKRHACRLVRLRRLLTVTTRICVVRKLMAVKPGNASGAHDRTSSQELDVGALRSFFRKRYSCHVRAIMMMSNAVISSNQIDCVNVYR